MSQRPRQAHGARLAPRGLPLHPRLLGARPRWPERANGRARACRRALGAQWRATWPMGAPQAPRGAQKGTWVRPRQTAGAWGAPRPTAGVWGHAHGTRQAPWARPWHTAGARGPLWRATKGAWGRPLAHGGQLWRAPCPRLELWPSSFEIPSPTVGRPDATTKVLAIRSLRSLRSLERLSARASGSGAERARGKFTNKPFLIYA